MELRNMKYFITIAQEGSITKAAELLHMTQPNLSRQIAMLEDELGAKLFTRTNRRSELTEDGRKLLQRFGEILALVDRTEQEFLGEKGAIAGCIHIGAVECASLQVMADEILEFQKLYPAVSFDVYAACGDDLKEKLAQGLLDFIFLTEPVDIAPFDFTHLDISERWGLLISPAHPLASRESIDVSELKDIPTYVPRRSQLRQEIGSWLDPSQDITVVGTYSQVIGIIPILERNHYDAAICLEGAASIFALKQLIFLPITPQKESSNIMLWKKDRMFSPAARLFRKMFMENHSSN